MKQAREKFGKDGFVVVGFNSDRTPEAMKAYIEKNGYDWSHRHMGGEQRSLEGQYWVEGYPTNFLVGRDGRILSRTLRLGHADAEALIQKALTAGK